MKILKWEKVQSTAYGNNPPIVTHQAILGEDSNGDVWMCRVEFRKDRNMFMVWFDKDVETDDDFPFLRNDVVYADNYWKAHQRIYHTVFCQYGQIRDIVELFMRENGIK